VSARWRLTTSLGTALLACAPVLACGGAHGPSSADRFVDAQTGEVAQWAASPDGRVRAPLRSGLSWTKETPDDGSLFKARAEQGPTYVVASRIDLPSDAGSSPTLRACAEVHRARLLAAATARGVPMTPPRIVEERHRGASVPRVSYAVRLEAAEGARPASLMSSWTYALDGATCYGAGVTTIVRARQDDPGAPDPEDLQRLEAVYALVADGLAIGSP
jgi:hypothetical protein